MLPAILDILGPFASALASAPPPLPNSPAIQQWLFERPILVGVALAAFGIAAFFVLNRRGDAAKGIVAGLMLLLLGIAATVTGIAIETPRERLIRLSNEFVDAVVAGETNAATAMLAPDLVVAVGSTPLPGGGGLARRAIESFTESVNVSDYFVTDESATVNAQASSGASQFLARATSNLGPGSAWVRLNWRLDPSGEWTIYLIEVLRVNGQSPEGAGAAQFLNR